MTAGPQRKWTIALGTVVGLALLIVAAWTALGFQPLAAWASPYSIELSAHRVDDDPMAVRLVAEITGGPDYAPGLYCRQSEWRLGDATMKRFGLCRAWEGWQGAELDRTHELTCTFEEPGWYTLQVQYAWLETEAIEVRLPSYERTGPFRRGDPAAEARREVDCVYRIPLG